VYIRDSDEPDGNVVAYFDADVTFTPTTGSMALNPASLSPSTVYGESELSWSIMPAHNLYLSDAPSLTIEVPTDYAVPATCTTTSSDAYGGSRTCTSNTIQNTLTISNLVSADWGGGGTLAFSTALVTLPPTSAGGQGEFRFTTYVWDAADNERYSVDATVASNIFTITAGGFESATVESDSGDALAPARHTFTVVPTHLMPQYGIIMVVYPAQVEIGDASLSQTLCADWLGFTSDTPVCTIFPGNRTIIVSKGLQQSEGGPAGETTYSWSIPYVTNPPTLLPTDSYTISTRDQFYSIIDIVSGEGGDGGVSLTITDAAVFQDAQLVLDLYQNSERTKYTFTFVASCQVVSGNVFLVVFPGTIALPADEGDLGCESSSSPYFRSFTCTKRYIERVSTGNAGGTDAVDEDGDGNPDDNAVLIEFELNADIPELETFSFAINSIRNPPSTAPTDPIIV
jgi:hypothetical protein